MLEILKVITLYLGWTFIFIGILISITGAIGCIRFPDLYTKLHALSVSDSLGVPISLTGLILINGFNFTSLKIFFIIVILLFVNPFSTHALIRSGIKNKIKPFSNIKTPVSINEVEESK
ncbi:MAG: monovalent cation/H(+) antiporter subunit G [Rickettsiales bacterium]|nr:monovalent cation/H(+) antiporter subunit G [Rickettsiales bacterium]